MPAFSSRPFRGLILVAVTATLGAFTDPLRAASSSDSIFTRSISSAEQSASGVTKLSAGERVALDEQIAREIALARQGDVVAFAKTFSERRTPEQIAASGLATLTPAERGQLDVLVARAVAQRPTVNIARFGKKPDDGVETVTYHPQLHGEVSLTYGMASGGRNYYGGSFTTIYDDPAHKLTVAFSYSEYHGKGLLPFCDGLPLDCLR